MKRKHLALALCLLQATILGDVLVPLGAAWKYTEGIAAPPVDWREATFNDEAWSAGPAPLYYGENLDAGTALPDMRYNYTTFYARRSFNLADPGAIDRLAIRVHIDDGYIAWINGREVARFNVSADNPPFDAVARAAIEPTWITNSLASPSEYLLPGSNVLAVQVFNTSPTSSDIVFDLELESTSDTVPPFVSLLSPAPGRVNEFTSVTVIFSEAVQGVRAEDFLVNNAPAREVTRAGATYTFTFSQPDFGPIDLSWDAGHQIRDLADPPHPFDASAATFHYTLSDDTAPFLVSIIPPPNTAVRQLGSVEIRFSEAIMNLTVDDLLLDGLPATGLVALPAHTYRFQFPMQPAGNANLAWSSAHGITDLATNAFHVEPWSYTIDPDLPLAQVVISEFLASAEDTNGLRDENGELQDWIELYNTGAASVNLAGWSLTDDPEEPGLWTFPSISLPAGGRLIVFASAKDRKLTTAGTRLHTNFKLGAGGEYLALFNADSPRDAITEFRDDYPEQRNDYSYGIDANGAWRYFRTPTPGHANGASALTGVVPKPDVTPKRGWHDAPFLLRLTNSLPNVTIRYTTNGNVPTETSGFIYSDPLPVSSNLVLRAAAFRVNHLPSEVLTHTYLFAEEVLRQPNDPAGFPVGPTVQSGYPSDYEMDPEIVNDPAYALDMVAALKALPVISISMSTEDMFGAANGIYTHPLSRGPEWERPCSIEFIPINGSNFQEDAGIQVQGNAAREPHKQPKHPLRVTFKGDYGAKKLDYKMFPDSPVRSFDTLILRADFNYSWLHWNPTQRVRAQRIRDSWVKDTMRAMGGLASHNRYVHLFINGLYWGIYDPSERPDGSFGEAYLGGEKEDYDVINEGAVVDGTGAAYNTLLAFGTVNDLAQYEAIKQYLDMPQFIDYMLLHFYMGHEDWGNNKNWYTIRPRDGSRGFLYIPWDGEMVLGNLNVNRVTNPDVPSGLHTKLIANSQYRLDFADRVHRHFFNEGALTPEENIARWQARAREIELPIIAESARWGDYRRDVHSYQSPPYELYTRDEQWRDERERLLTSYFPNRTSTVLNQLRATGLYPAVEAPVFNQHGGGIAPGFELGITAPAGTIYYTTDGSDPRVYGTGEVARQADIFSQPVILSFTTLVRARAFSSGAWSALTEATFITGSPRIPFRITEIMYHPEPAGEAFEFIELQNLGAIPLDVSGYYIEGVDYIFPPQSVLAPDEIILLGSAENPASFAQRYPGLIPFGLFGGQLLNRGERLALVTHGGRTVQSVDYDDDGGWPSQADGGGASLEIIDPLGDPDDPANWQASDDLNGSLSATNSAPPALAIWINETRASTPDNSDWLEFFASEEVELGGGTLTEASSTNLYVFPIDYVAAAGSYFTIAMGGPQNAHDLRAAFALDADSETLILSDPNGTIRHVFTYGPQAAGYTAGLIADQIQLTWPTPGGANERVETGPLSLAINEVVSNPAPGKSDWIEIYNLDTQSPASLQGLFIAVSNQLFEIRSAAFIGPGGFARLFADEEPGANHLDLKLSAAGETIRLLNSTGAVLDEMTYPPQVEGSSFGRFPDGTENFVTFTYPTPEERNSPGFPMEVTASPAGKIVLTWPCRAGQRYRVEYSETLPTWNPLVEFTGAGATATAEDSLSFRRRYYRVIALP